MEDALKANYEEGFEDGEEKGEEKEKSVQVIQQVCRKLQKGKKAAVITEELEEEYERAERICAAAERCGLEADLEQIYAVFAET